MKKQSTAQFGLYILVITYAVGCFSLTAQTAEQKKDQIKKQNPVIEYFSKPGPDMGIGALMIFISSCVQGIASSLRSAQAAKIIRAYNENAPVRRADANRLREITFNINTRRTENAPIGQRGEMTASEEVDLSTIEQNNSNRQRVQPSTVYYFWRHVANVAFYTGITAASYVALRVILFVVIDMAKHKKRVAAVKSNK